MHYCICKWNYAHDLTHSIQVATWNKCKLYDVIVRKCDKTEENDFELQWTVLQIKLFLSLPGYDNILLNTLIFTGMQNCENTY